MGPPKVGAPIVCGTTRCSPAKRCCSPMWRRWRPRSWYALPPHAQRVACSSRERVDTPSNSRLAHHADSRVRLTTPLRAARRAGAHTPQPTPCNPARCYASWSSPETPTLRSLGCRARRARVRNRPFSGKLVIERPPSTALFSTWRHLLGFLTLTFATGGQGLKFEVIASTFEETLDKVRWPSRSKVHLCVRHAAEGAPPSSTGAPWSVCRRNYAYAGFFA